MWTLTPHNGDLGTSGWCKCEAPTCLVAPHGRGVRAILAGEGHYITTDRWRRHVHFKCALSMVANGEAEFTAQPSETQQQAAAADPRR